MLSSNWYLVNACLCQGPVLTRGIRMRGRPNVCPEGAHSPPRKTGHSGYYRGYTGWRKVGGLWEQRRATHLTWSKEETVG